MVIIMKIIEHRRHSIRVKPSKHISQEGVNLARKVGEELGDFDRVFSSTAPRAIETAVAMGYAVDDTFEMISQTPEKLGQEIEWGIDFQGYLEAYQKGGVVAEYAGELADFLKSLVEELPEDAKILVISHGGLLELSVIGCFPEEDYVSWGKPLDCCEGVRMFIDEGKYHNIDLLRENEK